MTNPLRTRGISSLLLVTAGALALAVVAGMTLIHVVSPTTGIWHAHGMWNDGHMTTWGLWGWGMLVLGVLWMVLLVGLPAYLVYRLATRTGSTGASDDRALDVLREQYARGEIDDEEFDRRRSRLEADDGHN